VSIVAAGVVRTVVERAVRLAAIHFYQRKGVHIRPQQDCFAWVAAAQSADNPGLADASADLVELEPTQVIGDDAGGAVFLVGDLWMTMEISTSLDQAGALLGGQH
jgi:hypothetical protein